MTTKPRPIKPDNLPPLPEGAVYLGMGESFKTIPEKSHFHGWCHGGNPLNVGWHEDLHAGWNHECHYCAPSDSEIVKLNGWDDESQARNAPPGEHKMPTNRKEYLAMTPDWPVGTRVRVTRSATEKEGGWDNDWSSNMDQTISQVGFITYADRGAGFGLKFEGNTPDFSYRFPWFVLERVEEQPAGLSSDDLDDDHPLWCVNEQIKGFLEGEGATEDHDSVLKFFTDAGLPKSTATRIHKAIVCAEKPAKPTLGVMPHDIWVDHRVQDLARAIHDRADSDPRSGAIVEWATEIIRLREGGGQ